VLSAFFTESSPLLDRARVEIAQLFVFDRFISVDFRLARHLLASRSQHEDQRGTDPLILKG